MNGDSAYGTDGSGRRATASGDYPTVQFPSSSTRTAHSQSKKPLGRRNTSLSWHEGSFTIFTGALHSFSQSPSPEYPHLLVPTHPVVNLPAHAYHHPSRCHCHCHWRDSLSAVAVASRPTDTGSGHSQPSGWRRRRRRRRKRGSFRGKKNNSTPVQAAYSTSPDCISVKLNHSSIQPRTT